MKRVLLLTIFTGCVCFLSGCAMKYTYSPGKPLAKKPLHNKKAVVYCFTDNTDKKYSLNGNRPLAPIHSFSMGIAKSLQDRKVFREVEYIEDNYSDLDSNSKRNLLNGGVNYLITGSIEYFKWNDYPEFWSFLPFFWVPWIVGFPTEGGGSSIELTYHIIIYDFKSDSIIWKARKSEIKSSTHFGDAWWIPRQEWVDSVYSKTMNTQINQTTDYLAKAKFKYGNLGLFANNPDIKTKLKKRLSKDFNKSNQYSSALKNKWALIVGVSKYKHSGKAGLTNLAFADDDARAFQKLLLKQGWDQDHIKCLTDNQATKKNIEGALSGWLTKAGKNDLVVLYWSGHGYPDPGNTKQVYFACYDTDIAKPYTGWRMDKVVNAIKELETRNTIVVADTCHAGKLITRGEKGMSIRPYLENAKASKQVPEGWIYFVSAESDRKAVENSQWSNGAFTYCLIKGLEGKADADRNGKVTMLELKAYMSTAMPEETQKVLGVAKHPVILTNSSDRNIWNLSLEGQ